MSSTAKHVISWLMGAIGVAIVGTIITEFWGLIKAGALFDFLEAISGDVQKKHFIRTDLVSATKQSVAQWILAISCVIGWVLTFWSRRPGEGFGESGISGIVYGFTLGLGVIFLLTNFDRFKDIHLAVGDAQYALAGMAMIETVILAIVFRFRDRT